MRAAVLLTLLLLAPATLGASEIVIEAGVLTPSVLAVESDEPVSFTRGVRLTTPSAG